MRLARENGEKIIADPAIALNAITHMQATFTKRDLAQFAFRHSDGKDQFDAVMASVRGSPELVALGKDGKDQERFTSRNMIAVEERLGLSASMLATSERHGVAGRHCNAALDGAAERGMVLSGEQRDAFDHVTGNKGLSSVVGYAGSGKSAMLGVARDAWQREGYNVRGASLSGIAAENLEAGSGITSRTIASLEYQWKHGRELLSENDVLVIDEAGLTGTRQMDRMLSAARDAGAKVVLVGDPEQLQAIEAGAAFRSLAEAHGAVEITEIRRQHDDWQRGVTRGTDGRGYPCLWRQWDDSRTSDPDKSRIILTHTNAEVRDLNVAARDKLRDHGQLGADVGIETERGMRDFASGDRMMFLRNERGMGVKNGTLGTVEQVSPGHVAVRTDDGRSVSFDLKDYAHIDHGYAATFHKSQGVTVDQAHILATPGMDRHSAYVGLTRHRESVQLHYGRDDFADQSKLVRTLSRERAKDMASDYPLPDAAARGFAERREFRFGEVARDMVAKARSLIADPDRIEALRGRLDKASLHQRL